MAEKSRAEILGENLARIRKEKGFSRKQLADVVSVGVDTIGKYETGITLIPLDKIFKLADFLQVSVSSLTGENNFADSIPDVEKIVDEKIFEYRCQRAMKLADNANCDISEYGESVVVAIPTKIKHKEKDGAISVIPSMRVYKLKDKETFTNTVELVELKAIRQNITFAQAFENYLSQ